MARLLLPAFVLPLFLLFATNALFYGAGAQELEEASKIDVGVEVREGAAVNEGVPDVKLNPDVYVLPVVVEGRLQGLKRLLIGLVIMAVAIAHFSAMTYPKVMGHTGKFEHILRNAASPITGDDKTNKVEVFATRYVEYAQKRPEIAVPEAAAALLGFGLFVSGLAALAKPRRTTVIPKVVQ